MKQYIIVEVWLEYKIEKTNKMNIWRLLQLYLENLLNQCYRDSEPPCSYQGYEQSKQLGQRMSLLYEFHEL